MKFPAVLLAGSLVLNTALWVTLGHRPADSATRRPTITGTLAPEASQSPLATDPGFTPAPGVKPAESSPTSPANGWAALDTDDLPELVRRLRAAGFTAPVIRALLGAKIESLFTPRMKEITAAGLSEPAWKQSNGMFGNQKLSQQMNQLWMERSRMQREALGQDVPGADPVLDAARQRQFGGLSSDKIDLVQRINDDYAEMSSQVRNAQQGITLPEDREKLALLEREKRADLAAILTPEQLAEYEMRTSPVTSRLRPALVLMDASEAEFRTLFGIQQKYGDAAGFGGLFLSGTIIIPPTVNGEARVNARQQMFDEIKAALPAERYAEYVRSQNPEFQQLNQIARRFDIPSEVALRAFDLRDQVSTESQRIAADATLSPAQRRDALQALGRDARNQVIGTLGPEAGAAYAQSARWIATAERGVPSRIQFDGTAVPIPVPAPVRPKN